MASKSNQYRTKSKEEPKSFSGKKIKDLFSNSRRVDNEKIRQILGVLFCFVIPVFFSFSLLSFLFTWKVDISLLDNNWWEVFWNGEKHAENALGKLGAMLAYKFIYDWFGIASLLFIAISFIVGFRILYKSSLIPLKKVIIFSFFTIAWFPVFASVFIDSNDLFVISGAYGYNLYSWLESMLKPFGTIVLLLFVLLSFIIANFKINFNLPQKKIEKDENSVENIPHVVDLTDGDKEDKIEEDVDEDVNADDIVLVSNNDEEAVEKESSRMDLDVNVEEKKEETPKDETIDKDSIPGLEVHIAEEHDEVEDEENDPLAGVEDYDPTLELSSYEYPSIDLLRKYDDEHVSINKDELETNKNKIIETLNNYKIEISKIMATVGPTVTLYEIIPAPGVRISKIKNLEDDIALSLAALGIRIIAPMPGKGTIGIEVPNSNPNIVSMHTMIDSEKFNKTKMDLPVALGKTISNEFFVTDLAKMPHLLMAGATGQGKSVGLNAVLASLLYKKHPSQIKFVLVDPKKVELTLFNKIERHFLAKLPDEEDAIITDTSKVVNTLNSLCILMDSRYDLLKDAQVRNLKEYNHKFVSRKLNPNNGHHFMPYIVVVVDEFADLIMTAGKEVENPIARIAQLARAVGIHLIIATQRPSVNVITGIIKANFPARIAFRVTSKIDSRTILDAGGAEQLIGRGDMLFSSGSDLTRIQCAFVDTPEVERITEFIGSQRAFPSAFELPEYVGEDSDGGLGDVLDEDRDALFVEAARLLVGLQQGSTSLIQRKLKLGYNRAGRIIDQLEACGIVGPFEGAKARKVLIPDLASLEQFLSEKGLV